MWLTFLIHILWARWRKSCVKMIQPLTLSLSSALSSFAATFSCSTSVHSTPSYCFFYLSNHTTLFLLLYLSLHSPSPLKLLLLLFLNEFLLQRRTRADTSPQLRSAEVGAPRRCQIWASESERWKHHSTSAERRGSRSKSYGPRRV